MQTILMNSKPISRCRKNKKRTGFVLVSVMMLGVLLISCATAFAWFVRIQIRSVDQERDSLTKRSMATILANSIMNVLSEMGGDYDSPTQRWFQPFIIPFEDLGIWVLTVTPLDDKIPIRNLFLPDGNTQRHEFEGPFQSMLEKIGHRNLELPLLDFLDRNNKPRVGGVEREEFINRGPYDISELLILTPEINSEVLYGNGSDLGIADYCTVFSEGKINLNVAPVHVMELLPGLDERGLAERIAQVRMEEPITNFRDIQSLPGASPRTATLLTNLVGFKSRYFAIKIEALMQEEGGTSFNIIFDKSTKQIVRWEEI
ncbi:MAG: general secretion pathway protein GspK [Synergistaceae bacterium]|nr:general secretion pathway protein GspK [Synergistaceae bacterium]